MSIEVNPRTTAPLEALRAKVGGEFGVSRWFEVSQARIDAFADVIEDWQFIHVDPVAARQTAFGGAIAHGFLTLSMLSAMAYDALPKVEGAAHGVNYGFDKVRFLAPVPAGARIRARFRLVNIIERSATELQLRLSVEVEIEGAAKPALAAEWLTLSVLAP